MKGNPYTKLGVILTLSGAVLAPLFYFVVASVPLAALAISNIILGLVCVMLGNARPDISPEASQTMLRTGMENIGALLEELGLRSRAIYMPSSACGGRPRALIPLREDKSITGAIRVSSDRLITRYGPNLEDMGLMITTPGAISIDNLGLTPGGGPDQIEGALNQLLVGILDLADSVSVHTLSDQIVVQVTNAKLRYENIWFYRCLGSPLASIAATVVSEALNRPVRVEKEEDIKRRTRIEVRVLDAGL